MIQKIENCLYCGGKMESKRATKKFCSESHRLYYFRETKNGTFQKPKISTDDLSETTNKIESPTIKKANLDISTERKEPPQGLSRTELMKWMKNNS